MDKEKFCKIINDLKELDEKQNTLRDAMIALSPDFYVDFYPLNRPMSTIIDLLNEIFELQENDIVGTDIDYFIYELDYGRLGKEMPIEEVDGTQYFLTTPEELYNYLMKDK